MKDNDKTYKQLIKESTQLRRRIAELEGCERQRKKTEEALTRWDQEKAAILGSMSELVAYQDTRMRILWANRAAAESVGMDAQQLVGRHCYEIWHQRQRPCVGCPVVKARKSGQPQEAETTSPDGRVWLIKGYPVRDKKGIVSGVVEVTLEITDHKQTEEALREERDKAQQYLNIAEVILVALNKKGEITLINRKGNHILGYKEGELLGKNWFTTCVPSYIRKKIKNGFLKLMAGEVTLTEFYENPVLTKSGTGKMMAWHNALLEDTQGTPIGTLSSGEDITGRKETEEKLRENEERYRAIFEQAADSIVLVDTETGALVEFNNRAHENLGYTREEFEKLKLTAFEIIESSEEVAKHIEKIVKEGTDIFETKQRAKGGEIRDIQVSSKAISIGGKDFLQSIWRDITERKQAEEALRESEERYKTLFDETVVGICLADAETGIIIDCNEAMAALVDRERADLIGKPQKILHPSQDDKEIFSPTFKQHLTDKEGKILETQVVTKTGDIRKAEIKANLLDLQGRKVLQALFYDITERKQAEEELRESETRFRTLFEAIPDTVLVHDDEGAILHINEIGAQQLEWSAKDLVGRNLREIVTPENASSIADQVRETHKVGWSRFETTYVSRSGWRIMAEVNEHPIMFGKEKTILSVARDITERKQIEEALKAEKEFSESMLNAIIDTVFVFDPSTGKAFRWNKAFNKISDYSDKEISSLKAPDDWYSREDLKRAEVATKNIFQEGHGTVEMSLITKEGKLIPTEYMASSITDAEGKPKYIIALGRDITERKKADLALREKEETIRAFVETSQDWIWSIDVQGIHTYSNPAVEKILGYTPVDLVGKLSLKLIYDEDRRTVETNLPQWIKKKRGWQNLILRWKHKDGSWRWLESNAVPMFDAGGELIGFRGVDRDITERKQTEEALLREKIFSDTIMNSSPGLFFVFDEKGTIVRWNKNVEKVTGYSAQEISKMNVLDFVAKEDKKTAAETMQEVLSKGHASIEIDVLSKPGKKIPFYITDLRTKIENTICVVCTGIDITERKQAEKKIKRSYEQLQETLSTTVNALASMVEMKDQYTAGHQPRVTHLSCAIAEEMGLTKEQIEGIRMAGSIHDIGKIMVPAEILNKPGPLTEIQYEMVKMHSRAGYDILKEIEFPWPVAQIVLQHHELMDGSGYPQGLSGEEIMVEARILAVANVIESKTSHRPYRPAFDLQEALEKISKNRGVLYDPAVVDVCLKLFTEKGFTFNSEKK